MNYMNKLIDLFIEKTTWVNGLTIGISIVGLVALTVVMQKDCSEAIRRRIYQRRRDARDDALAP